MLEGANIKLSGTIRDINGKSSRAFLARLLNGEKLDAAAVQEMYDRKEIAHNLKASNAQLVDDLNGVMTPLQRKLMKKVLRHIDELDEHIRNLDDDINNQMKDDEKKASAAIQDITGIAEASANAIISVIGTDMGRFPSDAHISSWAGLCPGNNESAKKRGSGKTCKGNVLLRSTLVVCAHSAVKNNNSYFSAQFQRISAHSRGGVHCRLV